MLPVTLAEATLGAKVDVPTPSGVVALSIPAGSSGGRRLRLKGQGVRQRDGDPGDLIVELQVQLPKSLDEDSKALIEQFTEKNPMSVRDGLIFQAADALPIGQETASDSQRRFHANTTQG